ncbi:MAG: hypothetical protein JSS49_25970 [Planctomycetes bacterium]|nr:hypothetical protein [Planctomycetota bacterium]
MVSKAPLHLKHCDQRIAADSKVCPGIEPMYEPSRQNQRRLRSLLQVIAVVACLLAIPHAHADVKTWDGKHSIDKIEVTVVYFLPQDRVAVPDWKERVSYYCRRIEQFHQREFQGQSVLTTVMHPEPLRSARTTRQLRDGDANFTFFQSLREVDDCLEFGRGEHKAFPILLVLSDINWKPLDDFYRTKPGEDGKLVFEGNYSNGRHFPGAEAGGARATYLADRGIGWGLVSGDGWRVPYSGSDCVVYHEGVGHTVGLPHPEPGNNSVMSMGQYHGWISQSWVDDAQKKRLGWNDEKPVERTDLFSRFMALPDPVIPKPNEPVMLKFTWPEHASIKQLRVRFQTDLFGPWIDADVPASNAPGDAPESIQLGRFDRGTPVSYRVDAKSKDGHEVELWGYFQVREQPDIYPQPRSMEAEFPAASRKSVRHSDPATAVDLLELVDLEQDPVQGQWSRDQTVLASSKTPGARIELPYQPPEEYELVVIAEPLDDPNGLILGQRSGEHRFLVLLNYANGGEVPVSALENVDGKNVMRNTTSVQRKLLVKGRPSQIVCTVRKQSVTVTCDGHEVIAWQGVPRQLSLSDYWKTPHDQALFLGAYDCRYRFHRVTLTPLSGEGKKLR